MSDKNLEQLDIVDILLDDENCDNIFMLSEKGETLEFEQIAVIPYEDDTLYCVLKPVTEIEGIGEDEALVFKVNEDGEPAGLVLETDYDIINDIFDKYYELVEEQGLEDGEED